MNGCSEVRYFQRRSKLLFRLFFFFVTFNDINEIIHEVCLNSRQKFILCISQGLQISYYVKISAFIEIYWIFVIIIIIIEKNVENCYNWIYSKICISFMYVQVWMSLFARIIYTHARSSFFLLYTYSLFLFATMVGCRYRHLLVRPHIV